jgi:hypothetical protein
MRLSTRRLIMLMSGRKRCESWEITSEKRSWWLYSLRALWGWVLVSGVLGKGEGLLHDTHDDGVDYIAAVLVITIFCLLALIFSFDFVHCARNDRCFDLNGL